MLEFGNYFAPSTFRLSFKNISENVEGCQEIITLYDFVLETLSSYFSVLMIPLKRAGRILILRV